MENLRHRVILDEAALQAGLDALAERLRPRLEGKDVTVVVVLGGAVIFAADLVRRLQPGLVMDFLRIQSYGAARDPQRAPHADWRPHAENVIGRHVLLVDDVLDTGRTLREAVRVLGEEMGAASVITVVLVDKPARRALPIQVDDCVLRLEENLFLVGYGLDLGGRYRNLPRVLALEDGA
ncbi:MAG: hypoxanthine phosphoribosyltransferase [Planctomycetota bacterium]|nr:MAG: hypoxanthine phosphoribosyltransferase [Planctomycetota bacterium]